MRRSWMFTAACAALIISGCASSQERDSRSGLGKAKVAVAEPEIQIMQLSEVPSAATHITGNMPVRYQIQVANHAKEAITLIRLNLQSMGAGAYTLDPTSRPFQMKVAPDGLGAVEFWAPARIDDSTVFGANGPVTLRLVAQFDSPMGQFQKISVLQVHADMRDSQ